MFRGLGDVALGLELRRFGSRCHRYSQDTHHPYFCESVLMFCHNHEAALRVPSPRHHHAAERRRSLGIIAAGLGSGSKLTRHVAVSDLLSLSLSCRATQWRPRHSRSLSVWTVARWTCWCRSCTRAGQTPSSLSSPGQSALTTSRHGTAGPPRPRSCSSRHIGQRAEPEQRRTSVDPSPGHGQHPRQRGHPGRHEGRFPHVVLCFPPRRTSYLQPCDVAVFRSSNSCIQTQASATLARFVLDGSFEGLAMNKAWRRQSSADWAARAVTDLCDENKNKAWTTGWHPLRAHSGAHLKEAVTEAAALHAHDELFSKHIEPEPALEDPVDWAMAEGVRRRRRRAHARRTTETGAD